MNPVFPAHLRRAHGLVYFGPFDRLVLALAAVPSLGAGALLHPLIAPLVFAAFVALVVLHRRLDHHRVDHLQILFRRFVGLPVFSLCERDEDFVEFAHGKKGHG